MAKYHGLFRCPRAGLFLFLVMLGVCRGIPAATLSLDDQSQPIGLGPYFDQYLDNSSGQSLGSLLGKPGLWQPSDQQVPNFGFTTATVWLRLRLENRSPDNEIWFLEIPFPHLDYLDVYLIPDGAGETALKPRYQLGDHRPFSARPLALRNYVVPLRIRYGTGLDLYLRVRTQSSMQIPARLWRRDSYLQSEQSQVLLQGVYFGAMLVVMVYAGLLSGFVRDYSYLYFLGFVACLCVFEFVSQGFAAQYWWPAGGVWNELTIVLCAGLGVVGLLRFTQIFLNLPRYMPRLHRLCWLLMILAVAMILSQFVITPPRLIIAAVLLFTVASLVCIGTGLRSAWLEVTGIRQYNLAWGLFLALSTIDSLVKFGLLPSSRLTQYGPQAASLSLVLFMSFALTARVNSERRAKLLAQREANANLRRYQDLFENAVEGMYQSTLQGRFLRVNRALAQYLGYDSPEQVMDAINDLGHQVYVNSADREAFVQRLKSEGQVAGMELQGRRRDGSLFWAAMYAQLIRPEIGDPYIEGSMIDITGRKQSEQRLSYLARHDPLTELLNRREFELLAGELLGMAREQACEHSLMFLDLDQFKLVNDTCGHAAGDALLRQITALLRRRVRQQDTLARLGGDEFGVLLANCSGESALRIAHELRRTVQDFRFHWQGKTFALGVSIGLVPIHATSESVERLMAQADTACYAAKDAGRNRVHAYDERRDAPLARQQDMEWANRIALALERERFTLFAQPIVALAPGDTGLRYELLLRLRDEPSGELIPPGAFLPAAERFNLMPAIDRWVISHGFAWLAAHPDIREQTASCAINLCGYSLGDDHFRQFLLDAFAEFAIPPAIVTFEITESIAVQNLEATLNFIQSFRDMGCRFALDDFGSGFSSYGYLKTLPVDILKIDGSFVRDIAQDPIDRVMVRSIHDIGRAMNKRTVAEFAENEAILKQLREIGVDYAQGYGIAAPMPLDVLLERLHPPTP